MEAAGKTIMRGIWNLKSLLWQLQQATRLVLCLPKHLQDLLLPTHLSVMLPKYLMWLLAKARPKTYLVSDHGVPGLQQMGRGRT